MALKVPIVLLVFIALTFANELKYEDLPECPYHVSNKKLLSYCLFKYCCKLYAKALLKIRFYDIIK